MTNTTQNIQREIKFRAWDKALNRWLSFDDGDDVHYDYSMIKNSEHGWYLHIESGEDIVLMQYTGLKDKNGKEIYEGDLLKWQDSEDIYEVMWKDFKWVTRWWGESGIIAQYPGFYDTKWNIVGNLYENPELI
jgi:uncharacterized phage protein (TIGR01671 family)